MSSILGLVCNRSITYKHCGWRYDRVKVQCSRNSLAVHIYVCTWTLERFGTCRLCWDLLNWLCQNSKGFFSLNELITFRVPWRRPVHSGQNVGKIISPFLAGTEEPFTVHATASWEASTSLVPEQLSLVSERARLPVPKQLVTTLLFCQKNFKTTSWGRKCANSVKQVFTVPSL